MKIVMFVPTWVIMYTMLAIMLSIPMAFAFWDASIFMNVLMFWEEPTGGGVFIRAWAFVFSFIFTCASFTAL